jgi:hypothetical protein
MGNADLLFRLQLKHWVSAWYLSHFGNRRRCAAPSTGILYDARRQAPRCICGTLACDGGSVTAAERNALSGLVRYLESYGSCRNYEE